MILGIIQARMSSSRLPGKVLEPILGVPMLMRQIERVRRMKTLDGLTVATSSASEDDPIEVACTENGVDCFRGSLPDVLDRFYRAAESRQARTVVRITGDCPLIDPDIGDRVVELFVREGCDYASNRTEPTFPDGLDVDVIDAAALRLAWEEAELPSEREHIVPFFWGRAGRFRMGLLRSEEDLSHLRWTVDEPEDLAFVRAVYQALYPETPDFGMDNVLHFIHSHPEVAAINRGFIRDEGYAKSRKADPQGEAEG